MKTPRLLVALFLLGLVSLAVDITNYLMLELGQPLHAFDRARLRGPVVVRRARPGERLETLDHVVRELDPDDILITDSSGPISMAGTMGGLATEITEDSRDQAIVHAKEPVPGSEQPFAIGHEGVGEVIDVGPGVKTLRPGDVVAICHHLSCGTCDRCLDHRPLFCRTTNDGAIAIFGIPMGAEYGGLFSELVRVPFADQCVLPLPPNVTVRRAFPLAESACAAVPKPLASRFWYWPSSVATRNDSATPLSPNRHFVPERRSVYDRLDRATVV